ncbi:MAG: cytochrome b5 domain-containing protein [archaeon]|jgi:cytochrome b involved in lipid metabolism
MKIGKGIAVGLVFLFVLLLFGCTQSQPKVVTPTYNFINVGSHNAPEDCWVSFNGSVYDITPMTLAIPQGATSTLVDLCGTNATETFAQASSVKVPAEEYLIGKLVE